MKKYIFILFAILFLSGCATYQFKKGAAPYDKGYLVSYDGKALSEYTLGKENSVPDLTLAKERFNRRRAKVEYYYKKMGDIESRWKEYFWNPPVLFLEFFWGIIRWPFIAVNDHKYYHNPKYKEQVDKSDEEKDALERARINSLKEKLQNYIKEDLSKENVKVVPVEQDTIVDRKEGFVEKVPAVVSEQPAALENTVSEEKPISVEQPPLAEEKKEVEVPIEVEPAPIVEQKKVDTEIVLLSLPAPRVEITANPVKGASPLKVKFIGSKSSSKNGKIISYHWDFGDGDTSSLKNPENTYWSATYGSREFIATLTIKDAQGQSATANIKIEVINQ